MRQLLLFILLSLTSTMPLRAQDEISRQWADKLDSLATKLATQQRYEDAIGVKQRQLEILKQLGGEGDSTYISELVFLGKYYYRNQQADQAAATLRKAVELYGQHVSTTNASYAFMLDNLALYLGTLKQSAEAEEKARQALAVYEKLGLQDEDLSAILIHVAEYCNDNGRPQEAIHYELRALNVMKQTVGEHSEAYTDELPYLKMYYEAAGEKAKADRVTERIKKLSDEREQGFVDLPKPVEFKTAEICHAHNGDALEHCVYFLNHRLNAPNMNEAASYIISWSITSADVSIFFGESTTVLATKQEYMAYMVAYIAATSYFCLTEGMGRLDEAYYLKTIEVVLDFYEQNKDLSGEVDVLEKYLKLRKKGKLENQLRKEYKKYATKMT